LIDSNLLFKEGSGYTACDLVHFYIEEMV